MFCRNCGKENAEGSQVCISCGQDLTSNIVETPVKSTSNNKKTKIIIISVVLILALLVGGALFFMFRKTTPDKEQLKKDFVSEVLKDDKYSISEFDITNETDGDNNQYKALANITYSDDNVEYYRQYEFYYDKYDKWVLVNANQYNKDSWKTRPISAPSASDYTQIAQSTVSNIQYDKFTPNDSKTTVDLDTGKATFVFSVEKSTKIQNITGEINFDFVFSEKSGKWVLSDYAYADSYSVKYNLIYTWSGDGNPYLLTPSEDNKVNFVFEITKQDGNNVEGTLKYNGKSFNLTGIFNEPASDFTSIEFVNEKEKKKVTLTSQFDGSAKADIDTQYIPDQLFYYGYTKTQYRDVEMSIQ